MAEDKAAGTEQGGEETVEKTPAERTQDRFAEYRQQIADGKSVFTEEEADKLATAADQREEAAAAGEEAAGEEDAGDEAAAGEEGAEEAAGEEGDEAAGEEGEEEAGEEESADDEGDEGAEITVELPGRNEGEKVEFVVDDQDSADALNRLNKGYLRGEQLAAEQAKVQVQWDEIDEIKESMATDAVGFIEKELPDVKERAILATSLLLDDKVFEAVQESLDEISDPEKREVLALKLDKQRRDASDAATTRLTQKRAAKAAVKKIGDGVRGLVPEGMEPERAVRFQVAAMNVAEELVGRLKRFELTEAELTDALSKEGLLDRFGIDLVAAPANGKKAAGTKGGAGKPPAKKSAGKKPAAQTVEGLKKASLRRKSIAGSASSGAGAPAATVELAKSSSVKDRIAEVRKKGLGNVLSGK